jgi:hypothetical protein
MAQYRIYHVDPDGHISTPPEVVECQDDQEAIEKATRFVNGRDIELWERDRFVTRLPSNEPK